MIVAMVIASILCIAIGIFPSVFYQILPYEISYQPYDFSHVVGQLQLLMFATLAFICLWHFKIYPPELNSTVLNSDWIYRKMMPGILEHFANLSKKVTKEIKIIFYLILLKVKSFFANYMIKIKVFDREVGQDTLIIIQAFAVILIILFLKFIFHSSILLLIILMILSFI